MTTPEKENKPQPDNQTQVILQKHFEALVKGEVDYERFLAEVENATKNQDHPLAE